MIPDTEAPISEHRSFKYFKKTCVVEYTKQFVLKVITPENTKDMFMDLTKQMTMSHSYKPVFLIAFLEQMVVDVNAVLENVVNQFTGFCKNRITHGLPAEKKP